jgi:16S rRNA (guanine966-N2)-methyltransferase
MTAAGQKRLHAEVLQANQKQREARVHITGGEFKGQKLYAPKGLKTRPTTSRTRETIFNILQHGIEDFSFCQCRVLDLFAGSGALGLEAASRGAQFVLFIDNAAPARGMIRGNIEALGLGGRTKIWRRDATSIGRRAPMVPFNLVFLDPPYGKKLAEAALISLLQGSWLTTNAVIVVEEAIKSSFAAPEHCEEIDMRSYGETAIHFLRCKS